MIALFAGSALFINTALFFIPPQAEKISQNAALEFYKQFEGEKVLIRTFGFKSYAHYFYAKKPWEAAKDIDSGKAFKGEADIPVYAVCKIHREKDFSGKYPNAKRLYGKNGFVFFKINSQP